MICTTALTLYLPFGVHSLLFGGTRLSRMIKATAVAENAEAVAENAEDCYEHFTSLGLANSVWAFAIVDQRAPMLFEAEEGKAEERFWPAFHSP
jgi:hypothetical protein